MKRVAVVAAVLCLHALAAAAQTPMNVDQFVPHRVKLASVDYKGKRAVKVVEDGEVGNGEAYAVLKGAELQNGTIEAEVAGLPAASAGPAARGFIGIAFRLKDDRFE